MDSRPVSVPIIRYSRLCFPLITMDHSVNNNLIEAHPKLGESTHRGGKSTRSEDCNRGDIEIFGASSTPCFQKYQQSGRGKQALAKRGKNLEVWEGQMPLPKLSAPPNLLLHCASWYSRVIVDYLIKHCFPMDQSCENTILIHHFLKFVGNCVIAVELIIYPSFLLS